MSPTTVNYAGPPVTIFESSAGRSAPPSDTSWDPVLATVACRGMPDWGIRGREGLPTYGRSTTSLLGPSQNVAARCVARRPESGYLAQLSEVPRNESGLAMLDGDRPTRARRGRPPLSGVDFRPARR